MRKLLGKVRNKTGDDERPASSVSPDWNQAVKERPAAGLQCTVTFANLDVSTTVPRGTPVLDAAAEAGVDLNHYCGGMCSCGSCRFILVSGEVSPLQRIEKATLNVVKQGDADRLGCQTLVQGDVVIEIPDQDF
ncbi:MAG: 2Fe-2S iron-sulfur cluster binding domain-containing protein [Proteobacteria bacterium]|nr:2Fe-2S iron-sulfur cluster binding domain-containing protein [Pseudomonadota bacterium]